MTKEKPRLITTNKFRVSFPHLFQMNAYDDNQRPRFSIKMIFDPGQEKNIEEEIKQAIKKQGWPANTFVNLPIQNGDDINRDRQRKGKAPIEGYDGKIAVTAQHFQIKPPCYDEDKNPILDPGGIYGGCYARAVVEASAYKNSYGAYASLTLHLVQKLADGESFGSRIDEATALAALDDDF